MATRSGYLEPVKQIHRLTLSHNDCLAVTVRRPTTTGVSAIIEPLPKVTVRVQVWMSVEMQQQLNQLIRERNERTGHRLTLSDLGREAFIQLLKTNNQTGYNENEL